MVDKLSGEFSPELGYEPTLEEVSDLIYVSHGEVYFAMLETPIGVNALEVLLYGGGIFFSKKVLRDFYNGKYENEERLRESLKAQLNDLFRLDYHLSIWRSDFETPEEYEIENSSMVGFLHHFSYVINNFYDEIGNVSIAEVKIFLSNFIYLFSKFLSSEFSNEARRNMISLIDMDRKDEEFEGKLELVLSYIQAVSNLYLFMTGSGLVNLVHRPIVVN